MMQYLLDANAVIALLNDSNSFTAQRARRHKPQRGRNLRDRRARTVLWRLQEPAGIAQRRHRRCVAVRDRRIRSRRCAPLRRSSGGAGLAWNTDRSVRCVDCRSSEGARIDSRDAQHCRIWTGIGFTARGLGAGARQETVAAQSSPIRGKGTGLELVQSNLTLCVEPRRCGRHPAVFHINTESGGSRRLKPNDGFYIWKVPARRRGRPNLPKTRSVRVLANRRTSRIYE